ncbi:hypothetical protein CVT26_013863 [Gymnopilus dilepis]|uniref:Reverse transcriptase domain-containing protein n=1 Tax=Gymnopilus dilepis TaxID=231916 RepID=A0A409Y602_9AGAR|nr:hypothetical protein CVT26_013863 [Gymnopilus dilepis]
MSSNVAKSSYGQTLHFITDIKLQELEKQRLAYQAHAKVLEQAKALGDEGRLIEKIETLARGITSWTGSGAIDNNQIVGGKLQLGNLEFWLLQARHDPSFSREIAEGWAQTLEDHIRHTMMRFDSAKLFGSLFNEWLSSGDSVALAPQAELDSSSEGASGAQSPSFVEVGRKEMHEQKEKFTSLVFEEHPVDTKALNEYLEDLFSSDQASKALEKLHKELKNFGYHLQRKPITHGDVVIAINGLLASDLMDEEKRTTLKAFQDNWTVIQEVSSVLSMRMASIESWTWPKEGIPVEFRRHLNGKYRAFTDPDIIDALLLHHIGVAWQVKLKQALIRLFDSKAWIRQGPPHHDERERRTQQLQRESGKASIQAEREKNQRELFFLTQLQDHANVHKSYDDGDDYSSNAPRNTANAALGPAQVKQKLLHIMTTECYLNTALHGTHATICSDLEWFGPSLPHASILTILDFLGMPKLWLSFVQAFLSTPLRFIGESEVRVRKRGTPISYSLSVLCGEAVIFIMDFAVNQRANGLFLHRMHDDLWLWDADVKKVAAGWAEMNKYAALVGLKFNQEKTGSAYVGPKSEDAAGLPGGDIRWGFLRFDVEESRFVIDQENVGKHIVEMRRQLASTKSVFGWVNTYNKYMAFFLRNLGGTPANCFGQAHISGVVTTLARIQRELFSDSSNGDVVSVVGYLRKVIKERFSVTDLPEGYFYFPIASGGLELRNTMLEILALQRDNRPLASWGSKSAIFGEDKSAGDSDNNANASETFNESEYTAEKKFPKLMENDRQRYDTLKDVWDHDKDNQRKYGSRNSSNPKEKFMSFEEYTTLRESWLSPWGESYRHMLGLPSVRSVSFVPKVEEALKLTQSESPVIWSSLDWYKQWVLSMYGEEVVKKFGGLDAVDPNLIPVGMVQLFRTSRIKLDQ